jgi:threonine/homoserine/homoserine lactone efflux protein
MSTQFWLTTLVVVATPGTGALFTIAAALARGSRAGVVASFACTLGTLPHVLAAVTGLAALLHTSAVAFSVVKYLGVAYLVYLAYRTWRDRSDLTVDEDDDRAPAGVRQVVVSGVLVNLLNPKLTIFFFAFLPQFVRPGDGALGRMLLLSAAFMAVTFVVFVLYGLCAAALRHRVLSRPAVVTWMRRTFAAAYLALAARLAVPERG